jgi:hypothetical protein
MKGKLWQQPSQFIILTNISKLFQKNFFIPRKISKKIQENSLSSKKILNLFRKIFFVRRKNCKLIQKFDSFDSLHHHPLPGHTPPPIVGTPSSF